MITPEVTSENPLSQEKVDAVASNATQNPTTPEVKQEEVREDPNWRAVRELRKKEKAEREAAEKRAQESAERADAMAKALEVALSKSSLSHHQQQQNYAAYPEEETEDERIEKKVQAAIAKREAEYQRQREEREINELPNNLKKIYSDYDQIVNEDNGAYLEYHHPEIYHSLVKLPQTFENCSNIYKIVKKLVPNATEAKKDEIKAENNFNKPKSMSTTSITQPAEMTSSYRISEEKRAQNWQRMQKTLKGLS